MSEPHIGDWRQQIHEIAKGWMFSDLNTDPFPATVILPLENPDLHQSDVFHEKLAEVRHYRCIATGSHGGCSVGVLKSKFGAPAVALAVEVLANMGVRTVIGVGFCGGLRPDVNCGDLVLPLASVRDDGTTARYVAEGYPAVADVEALDVLRHAARSQTHPCHCGVIWSTDGILLESTESVRLWAARNVIGVDMEVGALYTIARLRGLRASAILVASDNPATGSLTDIAKLSAGVDAAVTLGFELAARLAAR
jgi:uridine phosphorylase